MKPTIQLPYRKSHAIRTPSLVHSSHCFSPYPKSIAEIVYNPSEAAVGLGIGKQQIEHSKLPQPELVPHCS